MPTASQSTPVSQNRLTAMAPNLWPLARTGHRWLQRMKRHSAIVDGHRMVWLERGTPGPQTPSVILIHGFAAMKENWSAWLPLLPKHWHVIALDLPGFGESDYHRHACYRYESQAHRLRDWIAARGLDNVHLVGSSMGGAIATILAHRLEPLAKSLTVLDSAGIPEAPDSPLEAGVRNTNDRLLIPSSWSGIYRMFNGVGNGKPNPASLAMTGLLGPDLLKRHDAHRHIFADMAADAYAPVRHLRNSTLPLQVQWGDRDVITPTRCLEYYRKHLPHADIRLFRNVGHLPMLETPRRSSQALMEFIARHSVG